MIKNSTLLVFVSALLLFSCGIHKKSVDGKSAGGAKINYAYIEKFHEGVRAKSRGETKLAITLFETCLTIDPNDDAAHYALSELYLIDGNMPKAGAAIQKAAKLDPKNKHYISELAYFYVDQEKYELAVVQFEKLVKAEPRNPEYLYPYAECLVRSGKIEEAIKALTKTEDQLGILPEMSVQKFQLYLQIKQPEKALAEIEKARVQYPDDPQLLSALVDYYLNSRQEEKAIQTLETLAKTDDANGRVHLFLADMYRRRGEMDKFYATAKKGILGEGVDAETKTQFLSSLQVSGRKVDSRAIELAEVFVQSSPESSKPYTLLGDFHLANGHEDEALISYRKALEFDKSTSSLWNQVLLMQYQAQLFEDLATDSEEALKYFPTLPTFYLLNGVANIQLKKYDLAITSLEVGREYITGDNAMKAEFSGQMGEAYFGKKDFEKGKKWYEKALSEDPNSTLLLNNYAYRLAIYKIEIEQAEKLILTAIKKSPNQPSFIDTYGFILFQKGDYKNALLQFEKAFGLDNEDKVTAEHLGDVYIKLKSTSEAQKYWNKAKELGSKSKLLDKKIASSEYYESEL